VYLKKLRSAVAECEGELKLLLAVGAAARVGVGLPRRYAMARGVGAGPEHLGRIDGSPWATTQVEGARRRESSCRELLGLGTASTSR